jgi:hypothetical protein
MYWGPVNMSLEHIHTSWELVTMYWQSSNVSIEPLSMYRYTFTIPRYTFSMYMEHNNALSAC